MLITNKFRQKVTKSE